MTLARQPEPTLETVLAELAAIRRLVEDRAPCVLTVESAAKHLCVSPSTVRRLTKDGEIKSFRAGDRVLYRIDWLNEWMEERAKGGHAMRLAAEALEMQRRANRPRRQK